MTGNIVVRAADNGDAEDVARLLGELGYPSSAEEVRARLQTFAESRSDHALVAIGDDRVVGVASMSTVPMLAEGGRFARVTSLSVEGALRRQGVGRRLMAMVEQLAADAGCSLIEVSSGRRQEREAAHRFYPSIGYRYKANTSVVYWKPIEPR